MNFETKAETRIKRSAFNPTTGEEIFLGEGKNMITDLGLLELQSRGVYVLQFAHAGVGTSPNQYSSGEITVNIVGTAASASAAFFTAEMVGGSLVTIDGEYKILGFTDSQNITVAAGADSTNQEFSVWYTHRTALDSRTAYTQNRGSGSGIVYNGNKCSLRAVFHFPVETTAQTYNEIGYGNTYSQVAGRLLTGGDFVGEGYQYKLDIQIDITLGALEKTFQFTTPAGSTINARVIFPCLTMGGINSAGALDPYGVFSGITSTNLHWVGFFDSASPQFQDNYVLQDAAGEELTYDGLTVAANGYAKETRSQYIENNIYERRISRPLVSSGAYGVAASIPASEDVAGVKEIVCYAISTSGGAVFVVFSESWDCPAGYQFDFNVFRTFTRNLTV